jgi:hypothetical protein
MGMGNLRGFLNKDGAQIVAVCDVVTSGRSEYGPNANGYGNKGKDLGRQPARQTVEQRYAGKRRSGRFKGCQGYRHRRGRRDDSRPLAYTDSAGGGQGGQGRIL